MMQHEKALSVLYMSSSRAYSVVTSANLNTVVEVFLVENNFL